MACEEEDIGNGGEFHRAEREMDGGKSQSVNKTKVSYSKVSATKSNSAQSKAPLIITNEGTKDQNVTAEVALYIQNKQDSRNHHFEHADLAKLVVDVECKGAHKEPKVVLGQEGKQVAQEGKGVVQGTDIAQKNDDELQGGTTVSNPMGEESDPGFRSNHESDKQAIEAPVEIRRKTCTSLPCSLEVEVTNTRSRCDTPLHRSKMKGLHDLGEPSTHPRRSVRLSEKSSRARKELLTRGGSLMLSVSDGDFGNCNSRFRKTEFREEPTKL